MLVRSDYSIAEALALNEYMYSVHSMLLEGHLIKKKTNEHGFRKAHTNIMPIRHNYNSSVKFKKVL